MKSPESKESPKKVGTKRSKVRRTSSHEELGESTPLAKKNKTKKSRGGEELAMANSEFINRDVSWFNFNYRVLHEAGDDRTPLLERLKFLTIFYSNLDEFFMKRMGKIKRHLVAGAQFKNKDGVTWENHFKELRDKMSSLVELAHKTFETKLRPELKRHGIELLKWNDLKEPQKLYLQNYFRKQVFPVLTPLSVDQGHPFPFISNLSTSLGVVLSFPKNEEQFFARVKIPNALPQWIKVENEGYSFISLQELINAHLDDLFPSMKILSVMPFRVTRDSEIERDEDDAEDLLEMIEEEIKQRKFASVVRVEYYKPADSWIKQFLLESLSIDESDFFASPAPLDYLQFSTLSDLSFPNLRFEPWVPGLPIAFLEESNSVFNIIQQQDLIVHSPYESFSATVERLVSEAAHDPKVLAIKMTLYRTGDNSPFVRSLIVAAESGKQVVCLIELKARFDEERNIFWAQELESAGVHVVYGIVGLKTHAKILLIVRQEADELKCYSHIGTGNYNSETAKHYTDLGFLTCKEDITSDAIELFNYLTGRSLHHQYKKLLVAPVNMFQKFQELIERERHHAEQGLPAQIIAKFNNFEEKQISHWLFKASQAGVSIDLIIRGFCCLRPQVPGLSDNIRVISVIGRFLEHSRIYYFRAKAKDPIDGEFYIGSADWMYRNLFGRVEAIVPIEDRALKEKLWDILQVMLKDQRQAWDLKQNGDYVQRTGELTGTHSILMSQIKHKYIIPSDDLKT